MQFVVTLGLLMIIKQNKKKEEGEKKKEGESDDSFTGQTQSISSLFPFFFRRAKKIGWDGTFSLYIRIPFPPHFFPPPPSEGK